MRNTGISWTDDTWNPIRGCMNGEMRFVAEHLADPLLWKKPRRFSMSDLFHEKLTNEQIAAVFGVMAAAPRHMFQVLTKRARRMRGWFEWVQQESESPLSTCGREWLSAMDVPVTSRSRAGQAVIGPGATWPLPNVWLGVSVENQAAADERIPDLLATPAADRFLACEPLLGPVDLDQFLWKPSADGFDFFTGEGRDNDFELRKELHLVIAGCESGSEARRCDVEWLRALRDQCSASGVTYFLKQARSDNDTGAGSSFVPAISVGPASKRKSSGVIELPYLDGRQHADLPIPTVGE